MKKFAMLMCAIVFVIGIAGCACSEVSAEIAFDFSKMDADFYSYLLRYFDKWGGVYEWTETEVYYDYEIGDWVQHDKKLSRDLWDEEYANGSLEGPELKRAEDRIREFQEIKALGDFMDFSKSIRISTSDYRYDHCLFKVLGYFPNLEYLDTRDGTTTVTTELDTSPCPLLRFLKFSGNKLNISNNSALTYLSCGGGLTELDVSNNTALTELSCVCNKLTTLDVSKNTAL